MFKHSRLGAARTLTIVAFVCSGSMVVTAPTASASPPEWDGRGQICVEADDGGEPIFVVLTTSLAPNVAEENIWSNPIAPAISSLDPGLPLTFHFTVPDEFFDGERTELAPGDQYGFYLVSFEFVDGCDTRVPVDFSPCFNTTVGPDPWVLDLGDLHLLFYFYAEDGIVTGPWNSVVWVSKKVTDCTFEEPDGGPDSVGDLFDLIDELDLEFEYDLTPDWNINADFGSLSHLLEDAEEGSLPNTL